MKSRTYRGTRYACYFGFITQAIVNNLAPLLFIIFQNKFHVTYAEISVLVMANFITQLITDVITVKLVQYTGYRFALVLAHVLSGAGLLMLGLFPLFLPAPFVGLLIAVIVYAIGGGIIEVLVSPTVENLPGDAKAAAMSLLHSFYCWGQMGVVLISTVLLGLIGDDLWWVLPVVWSVLPFANAVNFFSVPIITPPAEEKGEGMSLKELLSSRFLLVLLVLMTCAGASELAVTQWASLLVEKGLGISKVMGDLLGPCLFALIMGIGRTFYGMQGEKLKIRPTLTASAILCVISYLLIALAPHPALSLVGCSLCGLSVAVMWPGTFSMAAATYKRGGTVMFALLAVFGDLGCASGPWLAGMMSDYAETSAAIGMHSLKFGILCGTLFPLLMLLLLLLTRTHKTAIE